MFHARPLSTDNGNSSIDNWNSCYKMLCTVLYTIQREHLAIVLCRNVKNVALILQKYAMKDDKFQYFEDCSTVADWRQTRCNCQTRAD